MAYQAAYDSDEDKKKAEEAGRPTSGVVGSTIPAGGSGAGTAPAAPTPGTGFVNLQQYLDQNKDEGGRLASAATGGLGAKADDFKVTAANTVDTAKSGIKAADGSGTAAALQAGIHTNAAGIRDAGKDFLGADYAGPTAGDATAGLASDGAALQDQLSKVDDPAVQAAALQKAYGGNGQVYSPGFGLLDQFLVNGTDSGRTAVGNVKAKVNDVAGATTDATNQLTAAESAARATLDANKRSVVDAAKGQEGRILTAAEQEAKRLSAQNTGKVDGADANAADALNADAKKKADLDALRDLQSADGFDYKGSFKAGVDAPNEVGGMVSTIRAAAPPTAAAKAQIQSIQREAAKRQDAATPVKRLVEDAKRFAGSPTLNGGRDVQDDILGPLGPSATHENEDKLAKYVAPQEPKAPPKPIIDVPAVAKELIQKPEMPTSLLPLSPALKEGKKTLKRWGIG